jgi:hypothetical protein
VVALLVRKASKGPLGEVARDLQASLIRSVDMGPVRGGLLPRLWFGLLGATILLAPIGGF